jgi:hypothetical protein
MALFERFHLSQEEVEGRLKRSLTGDPTRGEIGVLVALNANRLDDVQSRLAHEPTIRADVKALLSDHLQKARARWETRKAWSVSVPLPVWDEYARESRLTGRSVSDCLGAAIRRDYDQRRGTAEPTELLTQVVRGFHETATELLQQARGLVAQVGPINEIAIRLSRIESTIGSLARR